MFALPHWLKPRGLRLTFVKPKPGKQIDANLKGAKLFVQRKMDKKFNYQYGARFKTVLDEETTECTPLNLIRTIKQAIQKDTDDGGGDGTLIPEDSPSPSSLVGV